MFYFIENLFKNNKQSDDFLIKDGRLEQMYEFVKEKYPVKNIVLKEDISTELAPQASIIYNLMSGGDDYAHHLFSYITFHQIHFHLKNYVLQQRGRSYYKQEFVDIFLDYYIDNFIVIREITKLLSDDDYVYLNVWLDGYFLKVYQNLLEKKESGYYRIQPELFFVILLFLSLPSITDKFEFIPFTDIMRFEDNNHDKWEGALKLLNDLSIKEPASEKSMEVVHRFLFDFLNLSFYQEENGNFAFDDINTLKCLDLINFLISKTDSMLSTIKKKRENLQTLS